MDLFDVVQWKYNKPFLQFRHTSEQFWHRLEIGDKVLCCWFRLSPQHLARLDKTTGDYVFDPCKVCGPRGERDDKGLIWYPVYGNIQPRMRQHEVDYFASKWDDWARRCQADCDAAPDEPDMSIEDVFDRPLTKSEIVEITPIIWSRDILMFSDTLPADYAPVEVEPF